MIDRLRAFLAYDIEKTIEEAHEVKWSLPGQCDIGALYVAGKKRENKRTRDVVSALVECVEALIAISIKIERPISMTDAEQLLKSIEVCSDKALANLEQKLKETRE